MNITQTVPNEPRPLNIIGVAALIGLAGIIVFFCALAILAVSTTAKDTIDTLFFWGSSEVHAPQLAAGFFITLIGLFGIILWFGCRLSIRALAAAYVIVIPILAYLVIDESSLTRSQSLEVFSPAFPGADASYATLMRYGKQHSLIQGFKSPPQGALSNFPGIDPKKPEAWTKFITEHRTEIEAYWSDLKPVREWWLELDRFDRISDLTPGRFDAEVPAFQPFRAVANFACAIACLQALDGQGDAAISTILPVIAVARKLQPTSRTLVRTMMGVAIEHVSLNASNYILTHATVTRETRDRLYTVLSAPGGGEAGARRLMATEYYFTLASINGLPLGDLVSVGGYKKDYPRILYSFLNVIGPFIYNPKATMNHYATLSANLEDLVGRRQIDQIGPLMNSWAAQLRRPHVKNLMGDLILWMMVPAYSKVTEKYWINEDVRAELIARLNTH